ncbi:MAG: phosphatidylglycerophosphatase A [Alphaproteobacteria bacterium GM202ARS2]|nr:phosphatidylglycerophosphatase A [Alphaproteobacteria bacterium GM202ARS2]
MPTKKDLSHTLDDLCHAAVTLGPVGYLPKAPGTFASLLTACFLFLIAQLLPSGLSASTFFVHVTIPILLLLFFFFSWFAIERTLANDSLSAEGVSNDPQVIVIDEALGQALVLWLVTAHSLTDYVLCFVFFRLFDIYKPPPIDSLEHRGPRSLRIINDDLAAAVFAFAAVLLVKRLSLPFIS